jgi:uncharacterized protein involved in outer membrane biogenesis
LRIPWRRLLWLVIALVPVAAAGTILWLSTRDLSRYQAKLTDQIRKVTGRELATRVPLSVHLGREPALVAEGVTLSNAQWGTRPDLARVRKVTMYLDPFSLLLLGEARVGRVLLEGADIRVERNEAGDTNLEMLPPPDGSGPHPGENRSLRLKPNPAFPWIDTIEVRDSVLTIAEGAGRPPLVLEVPSGTFKSSAPNQPLQMEARIAAPQAAVFQLTGAIGSFDGWIRGLPGNIDLQGSFGDGKIAIKGSVGIKGTNLQIAGEGPDIAAFGPYIRLRLPSAGPYVVNAKASTLRSNLKVEVPTLKIGKSELSGEVLFRVDRHDVPTITVNLDANVIDAGGLRAVPAPALAGAPPMQKRFLPATPFSASWLGRSTLAVTARVGEVIGLTSKVTNASVTLNSSENRFALRAAASIGAGSAGFDLVYDPAGRIGQATLTATASRVSFEDLSALLGIDLGLKDAVGDIDLRLRGGGRGTREALNVASGTIEIAAAKGVWPTDGVAGWPAETQRLLGAGEGGVPFNCIAGRFEVSGGVANLRRLVVDTPRATLVGGGFVHLRSETWEFILAPEARDAHGVPLASTLRLKGGTGQPMAGALEPGLAKLLVGPGAVPSLVGSLTQISRQTTANACATLAPRVEAIRPGLRAQMPVPSADLRGGSRRPSGQAQNPPKRTQQ